MPESGYQKKGSTGSGDLDQNFEMRMVTVLLSSYLPHDFYMATPFSRRKSTGSGHSGHPTVRLKRRSTTFSPTEGGTY
ncbi:unnamed protein product [Strongylus vulgaris]|uniref:Uncharacterized protein n=1 Tax=Strongylus vulgaris TaxID=40348 RepID=A0A3P7JYX0_STRVU|nr:unnamed protein product [Strongylus vulgaris]